MRTEREPPRARARALRPADRYEAAPYPVIEIEKDSKAYRKGQPESYVPHIEPTPEAPFGSAGWHRIVVRHLAKHLPKVEWLFRRYAMSNDDEFAYRRMNDQPCPACSGSPGWLDTETLEHCPLCVGFLFLPQRIVAWYHRQRTALEANVRSSEGRASRAEALEGRHE